MFINFIITLYKVVSYKINKVHSLILKHPVLSQPTLHASFAATDEWERSRRRATDPDSVPKNLKPKAANQCQVTDDFKDFIGGCVGVFPYPKLLPTAGINFSIDSKWSTVWTDGEDRLLLLAFDALGVTKARGNYVARHAASIAKDYVVAKSTQQIRKHVTNVRTRVKTNTENHPINMYFEQGLRETEDLTYASWYQLGPGQLTSEAPSDSLPEVYLKHWHPRLLDSKKAASGKAKATTRDGVGPDPVAHSQYTPADPAAVFEYRHEGGGAVSMTIPAGEHVVVSTIDITEAAIAEAAAAASPEEKKKRSKKAIPSPSKATSDRIVKKYKKQRKKGKAAALAEIPGTKTPSPTRHTDPDSSASPPGLAAQATILEAAMEESGIEEEAPAAAAVASPAPKTAVVLVEEGGKLATATLTAAQGANMDLLAAFERVTEDAASQNQQGSVHPSL